MAVQSDWLQKDYYKVLGVPDTATPAEITKAYRRLARQYHPDANPDNAEAEERFKEISAAYDVIGDPEKRKEYDEIRRLGPMMGGMGQGPTGGVRFGTFRVEDFDGFDDFGDLLGGLFGPTRRRAGRDSPRASRGPDLEAAVTLSFEDAVFGTTTDIPLTTEVPCRTCSGTGARPGTQPAECSACAGTGRLNQSQGFFAIDQTCRRCGGRGQIIESPCDACRGRGADNERRQVKVRIPAGVDDGTLIRLGGRGGPGRAGGPPGDLYLSVRVKPHRLFGREGDNLTLTVPVTYPEAVLGAEVRVPTLDGAPVTLRVPPGTPSGRVLRVRGHGVARRDGSRGDLLVTVEVAVPRHVSHKERKALEALTKAMNGNANPRAHLGV